MGRLKIGIVLDDTLDTPDGVQQYILTLGSWLSSQGHEVHYLVGHSERNDVPHVYSLSKNIRVQFNGNRMSTPLPVSKRRIRRLLEQEKYDVLHVQIPYSPFLAAKIISVAPVSTALIGTFHIAPNSRLVSAANKVLGILTRRTLKRFDTILSVSPAAAAFARHTFGIETSVIPNVVHSKRFRSARPLPVATDVRTIVFVGRLVPRKGCMVLLHALNILKNDAEMPELQVFICGRGPLDDELKAYTKSHGLDDSIKFVGFVSEEEKEQYLRTADIAVYPSTGGESFGIVLVEAMAAEHPVVLGANNEGYRTVLEPYPDLLFPVLDPISLANKLKVYVSDENARKKALAWQHGYVQQFDVAVVGPRIVARYQQALRSRAAP